MIHAVHSFDVNVPLHVGDSDFGSTTCAWVYFVLGVHGHAEHVTVRRVLDVPFGFLKREAPRRLRIRLDLDQGVDWRVVIAFHGRHRGWGRSRRLGESTHRAMVAQVVRMHARQEGRVLVWGVASFGVGFLVRVSHARRDDLALADGAGATVVRQPGVYAFTVVSWRMVQRRY